MNVRRSIAVAAAVLAAPALSSCGFDVPTNQTYNPTVGTYDKSSSVDVLNAVIVSASDGQGTLVVTLVNNDLERSDRLVDVTGVDVASDLRVTLGESTSVPAGGFVDLSDDGNTTVYGEDIVPGFLVALRFTFDHGRAVELNVPVENYDVDGPYGEVPLP